MNQSTILRSTLAVLTITAGLSFAADATTIPAVTRPAPEKQMNFAYRDERASVMLDEVARNFGFDLMIYGHISDRVTLQSRKPLTETEVISMLKDVMSTLGWKVETIPATSVQRKTLSVFQE